MTNVGFEHVAAPTQLQDEPKDQENPFIEIDISKDNEKKICVCLKGFAKTNKKKKKEKEDLICILKEHGDILAWKHREMLGLNPIL